MFVEFSSHRPTYIVLRRTKEILKFANKSRGGKKKNKKKEKKEKSGPAGAHGLNSGVLGNSSQKGLLASAWEEAIFHGTIMALKKKFHVQGVEWATDESSQLSLCLPGSSPRDYCSYPTHRTTES